MNRTSFLGRLAGRGALAMVLVLLYLPIGMTAIYSFNASRIGTVWTGFSTRGYTSLWQERALWLGLEASLLIAVVASTLSVAVATLAALGVAQWRPRRKAAAQGLLALPLVTPDVIIAVALALFFHALHVEKGWLTVVLAHGVFGIAYAYVVVASAVHDLDPALHAAALDCGATPWQALWRVTVPILAPSLLVAWLLVFALSFDDFLITFMTKGPGADTLPIKIYGQLRFGVKPQTSALFVMLLLASLLTTALAGLIARRRRLVL
jgi:ABC-type spermidine/putrescine transport system permease subunit II